MAAPLLIGHRTVGAIACVDDDPSHRSAPDLRLLSLFAPQAAMKAIENARLYSAAQR